VLEIQEMGPPGGLFQQIALHRQATEKSDLNELIESKRKQKAKS
jgi:hypothetical protein